MGLSSVFSESSLSKIWEDKRADIYQSYTDAQLEVAQKIFEKILRGKASKEIVSEFKSLNLNLIELDDYYVVVENKKPYSGHGMFVVRKTGDSRIFMQAPHAYHDMKTGRIALKIMQENDIKVLAVNTLNRRYKSSSGKVVNSDMAHLYKTLFVQFSKAFSNVFYDGKIIQLHGFNANKHMASDKQELIVSNGTVAPDRGILEQSYCLRNMLSINVHVYPKDVNFLGGTTNAIGRVLRDIGFLGFEHIEMSLPLRKSLSGSKKQRQKFTSCLKK